MEEKDERTQRALFLQALESHGANFGLLVSLMPDGGIVHSGHMGEDAARRMPTILRALARELEINPPSNA